MDQSLPQILKRLRKQQGDISQRKLAKQSGLSTSIICKIEQDKASPVIRSTTLEMIANGLGLSTDSPDRRLLFEVAWEREQRNRVTTSDLAQLLGAIKASFPDETSKEGGVLVNADDLQKYSQPQVLTRMEEVADCIVWMLDQASKLKLDNIEEILDTTQGSSSLFHYMGQEDRWIHLILSAMEHKWNVVSLYRMTGDLERAFEVVREIRTLSVYPEQYIPRYFRQIGALRPTYNMIIVPHIGAMLSLSTHNPAVVDAAFFYPAEHSDSAPYIKSLTEHFNLLFAETTQLARTYKRHSTEWEDTMTATCQLGADQLLANNCIDNITMPPALYDELLEQSLRVEKGYSAMAFRRLKTHHIQRREAFERNVKSFKYLTIMPRRSFEIALGLSKEDNKCRYPMELPTDPSQSITVDKRQAFEHIEFLIDDLRHYNNFEIALIEDNHPYLKYLQHTPWLVKGEASVLTSTFTENGVIASELELSEASIVRSYRQEFLTIWNEVAGQDKAKQKENVIGELMKLLDDAGYKH